MKKRLYKNTVASLFLQIIMILCGFVLPRLILVAYGSEVNGLVNSITQFLAVISLLDLGMGAVVQSALYKPLADDDEIQISKIVASSEKFFRKIAIILVIYIIFLIFFYPSISGTSFDHIYTATLIVAVGISSVGQYFFGITDRLFLTAMQREYIFSYIQIGAIIMNTVACVILIQSGASIQLVKFTTSLIYVIRPIIIRKYINKFYNIDRRIKYDEEPIQQKWNGIAQHISYYVLIGTDSLVLTIFASLSEVSVYSVYHLVIAGIKSVVSALFTNYRAMLGELWAKKDYITLEKYYKEMEWLVHVATVFLWGCTLNLMIPFVRVYTDGVNDVNYIVPEFAVLIIAANAVHSLRFPYNTMIFAVGHYKQTQSCYIIAAVLNIVISIVMVRFYGLVGVAIGTLVSMGYQTVWMALYNYKNLVKIPMREVIKQIVVDALSLAVLCYCSTFVEMKEVSYRAFFVAAIKVVIIAVIVIGIINSICYKDRMKLLVKKG